jgi:hypothetical protein
MLPLRLHASTALSSCRGPADELVVTREHKDLAESFRFQLGLLRLAVVPHGNRRISAGADAVVELARLAEILSPAKPSRDCVRRQQAAE